MNRLAHETLVGLRRSLRGLPATSATEAAISAIALQIDHLHEHAAGEILRCLDDLWIGMLGAGLSKDAILQAVALIHHSDHLPFLDGVDLPADVAALHRAAATGLVITKAPQGADLNALNAGAIAALDAYYGAPFLGLVAHFERISRFAGFFSAFGDAFGRVYLSAARPTAFDSDTLALARAVAPGAMLGLLTDSWLYLADANPSRRTVALPARHGIRKADVEEHAKRHGLDPDACWKLVRRAGQEAIQGALLIL
jgi:hypothetical protein